MTPERFWMVWVDNTPTTNKRHPTLALAAEEADRLARQPNNIGRNVYVLTANEYRFVDLDRAPLFRVIF